MQHLYRVVDKSTYETALSSGLVPRCNSDKRSDLVHLNTKDDVELVAGTYFEEHEFPLVLEVNPSSFIDKISWHEPSHLKPWTEARAKIPNIRMCDVVATHKLNFVGSNKQSKFRIVE